MIPSFQEASKRVESCNALRSRAVRYLEKDLSAKTLEPFIVELQRGVRLLEEAVAAHGIPGAQQDTALEFFTQQDWDVWGHDWYWSGVDDLKRLKVRVNFYASAIQHAKTLPDPKEFLYERVYLPVFRGSRYQDVADPTSSWIDTVSDFCEPARIYKNYAYALQVDAANTGVQGFVAAVADVILPLYVGLAAVVEALGQAVAAVVRTAHGISKLAIPLAIAAAWLFFRKQK